MSEIQILSHVVRRGLEYSETAFSNFDVSTTPRDYTIELSNGGVAALVIILLITGLLMISVNYTVGNVISTLCMIESPSTTTIIDAAPPAYTDEPEPDAPLNKNKSNNVELNDVEVLVVANKPVTASIRGSVKHLCRVGGCTACLRGVFIAIFYQVAVGVSGGVFGRLLSFVTGIFVGQIIGYFLAIMMLCRLHMLWTHSMIAMPTSTRWYKRFVPRKQAKAILIPAAVQAIARQLCFFVPMGVASLVGLFDAVPHSDKEIDQLNGLKVFLFILRALAVPASMLIMVLFVYIPAATTLTRIEACLLPENQETVVPFDREAIMCDIDMTQRGSNKQLFRAAWKSFNNAARMRLVKLYLKLALFQFVVFLVGVHLVVGVLFLAHQSKPKN